MSRIIAHCPAALRLGSVCWHATLGQVVVIAVHGYFVVTSHGPIPSTECPLDLEDATGRAHLGWWLMGLDHGYMDPLRRVRAPMHSGRSAVVLRGMPQDSGFGSDDVWGHPVGRVVPALADLDPDEPALLPDGSRRVDAEALRIVAADAMEREAKRRDDGLIEDGGVR